MMADQQVATATDYDSRWQASRDPKTGKILKGAPGRKPGARNHRTKVSAQTKLQEVEAEIGPMDPLEGMARIAADMSLDVQVRLTALKELARYIYPQRKAIDMSIEEQQGEPSAMSDTDLESIIEGHFGAS